MGRIEVVGMIRIVYHHRLLPAKILIMGLGSITFVSEALEDFDNTAAKY